MAETVGFEPTVSFPTHAFQACRFGRSRTSPGGDDSLSEHLRRQVAAGSCAIGAREPGQGRKAAALSGTSGVPQIAWPPPDDVSVERPGGGRRPGPPRVAGRACRCGQLGSDRGPSVPVPAVPTSSFRRGPRAGPRRRGAAQRRAQRVRGPRLPVLGPPRHRQDLHGAHPGQGAQLREPPERRAVLRVHAVRRHGGRPQLRPVRARRRLQQRRRRRPRPDRAHGGRLPRSHQGVHPRRGPHALAGCVQRPAEDARGAARPRAVRAGHDRSRRRCCRPSAAAPSTSSSSCSPPRSWSPRSAGSSPMPTSTSTTQAIAWVVQKGRGSSRDTLSALDQVVAAGGVVARAEPVERLYEALVARDTRHGGARGRGCARAGPRPAGARRRLPRLAPRRVPGVARCRGAPPHGARPRAVRPLGGRARAHRRSPGRWRPSAPRWSTCARQPIPASRSRSRWSG